MLAVQLLFSTSQLTVVALADSEKMRADRPNNVEKKMFFIAAPWFFGNGRCVVSEPLTEAQSTKHTWRNVQHKTR
jgi:hypothetical protein